MDTVPGALITDFYQLAMAQAYLDNAETEPATFELFIRKTHPKRRFFLAAGLDQALAFLEGLRVTPAELAWLRGTGELRENLLGYLADLRFTGEVAAVPEGTVVFEDEPLLRVTAPMPVAQLVETRLLNIIHYQTLVASKAARLVLTAPDKTLVEYGLRRAHGAEAGIWAARASFIAGFAGTATVEAAHRFGIPMNGTMAHSFIQAHEDEATAFERFARARNGAVTLLLDTYDTEAAARKVVALAPKLAADGIAIRAVRLDSGDLAALARSVRSILDAGGLQSVRIIASGGLDEADLAAHGAARVPIDGYGIGTALTTSADLPSLDAVYKLQDYKGHARRKRSTGKATWPGLKQVWRTTDETGRMLHDVLSLTEDRLTGETLLVPVMREGRRLHGESLATIRERAARSLAGLPEPLRRLDPDATYRVDIAEPLRRLTAEVDERTGGSHG